MLRKGSNGEEILNILDVIVGDSISTEVEPATEPTLDEISF